MIVSSAFSTKVEMILLIHIKKKEEFVALLYCIVAHLANCHRQQVAAAEWTSVMRRSCTHVIVHKCRARTACADWARWRYGLVMHRAPPIVHSTRHVVLACAFSSTHSHPLNLSQTPPSTISIRSTTVIIYPHSACTLSYFLDCNHNPKLSANNTVL